MNMFLIRLINVVSLTSVFVQGIMPAPRFSNWAVDTDSWCSYRHDEGAAHVNLTLDSCLNKCDIWADCYAIVFNEPDGCELVKNCHKGTLLRSRVFYKPGATEAPIVVAPLPDRPPHEDTQERPENTQQVHSYDRDQEGVNIIEPAELPEVLPEWAKAMLPLPTARPTNAEGSGSGDSTKRVPTPAPSYGQAHRLTLAPTHSTDPDGPGYGFQPSAAPTVNAQDADSAGSGSGSGSNGAAGFQPSDTPTSNNGADTNPSGSGSGMASHPDVAESDSNSGSGSGSGSIAEGTTTTGGSDGIVNDGSGSGSGQTLYSNTTDTAAPNNTTDTPAAPNNTTDSSANNNTTDTTAPNSTTDTTTPMDNEETTSEPTSTTVSSLSAPPSRRPTLQPSSWPTQEHIPWHPFANRPTTSRPTFPNPTKRPTKEPTDTPTAWIIPDMQNSKSAVDPWIGSDDYMEEFDQSNKGKLMTTFVMMCFMILACCYVYRRCISSDDDLSYSRVGGSLLSGGSNEVELHNRYVPPSMEEESNLL